MKRLLSRRQITLFLSLLLTVFISVAVPPARAAGPEEAQSWTLDIGQNLGGCCWIQLAWRDAAIFDGYHLCSALPSVELSREHTTFELRFEPSQGKVTAVAVLSGSGSDKFSVSSTTHRMDGGRVDSGWVKPDLDGGWEFGGTLVFDATLDIAGRCQPKTGGHFVEVRVQKTFPSIKRSFEGKITVDTANDQVAPKFWSLEADDDDQVSFWMRCDRCSVPAGVPRSDSRGPGGKQTDKAEAPAAKPKEDKLELGLGCLPSGDGVACSVGVHNRQAGEAFEYTWKVDGTEVRTTDANSVQISSMAPGRHVISVRVTTRGGRSGAAEIIVEIDGDQEPDGEDDVIPDDAASGEDDSDTTSKEESKEDSQHKSAKEKSDKDKSKTTTTKDKLDDLAKLSQAATAPQQPSSMSHSLRIWIEDRLVGEALYRRLVRRRKIGAALDEAEAEVRVQRSLKPVVWISRNELIALIADGTDPRKQRFEARAAKLLLHYREIELGEVSRLPAAKRKSLFRDASVAPRDAAEQAADRICRRMFDLPIEREWTNPRVVKSDGMILYGWYYWVYQSAIKEGYDAASSHRSGMNGVWESVYISEEVPTPETWQTYGKAFRKLGLEGVEPAFSGKPRAVGPY